MAAEIHFINILGNMLTDYFKPVLWVCLFVAQRTARTANNPIEKLAGSPVLSSALINNSAVRVNVGREDLVTGD